MAISLSPCLCRHHHSYIWSLNVLLCEHMEHWSSNIWDTDALPLVCLDTHLPNSASQIQLWCWHCAPYKCSYYYYQNRPFYNAILKKIQYPTPLVACGASILAPAALDLGAFGASCPPNEISGSAPAWPIMLLTLIKRIYARIDPLRHYQHLDLN